MSHRPASLQRTSSPTRSTSVWPTSMRDAPTCSMPRRRSPGGGPSCVVVAALDEVRRSGLGRCRTAAEWYEERVPGYGERLFDVVEAAVASIERHPRAGPRFEHPRIKREVRRALLQGFPYSIY